MNSDLIAEQAGKIKQSGCLGKSETYERLFDYLVQRTLEGRPPKEVEIAIDIFGRDAEFDANQDSLIRVYIYHLRNKLATFYEGEGASEKARLSIPKGTYRIQLQRTEADAGTKSPAGTAKTSFGTKILIAGLVVGLLILSRELYHSSPPSPLLELEHSTVWRDLLSGNSSEPVQIVLGDTFMLSELNDQFEQFREIRDFAINNEEDFELYIGQHEEFQFQFRKSESTYLPHSVAVGTARVTAILDAFERDYRLVSASELTLETASNAPLIYLGMFSSLNDLREIVFDQSRFRLHPSSVVLIDRQTGDIFAGQGTLGRSFTERYIDYAVLVKTKNETGQPQIFFMAARDVGLAELIDSFTATRVLEYDDQISDFVENGEFELLYQVSGNASDQMDSQITQIGPRRGP